MSKTTVKTLRYYDEIGILKPEGVDRFTSYRLYTTNQLLKLHQIQAYRQMGLTIENIKDILNGGKVETVLFARKTELLDQIVRSQEQLSRIEFMLSGKQEDLIMSYQAIVKELPECIVYSKKLTVPDYNSYFKVIPAIGEQVTKQYPDLECSKPEYCFICYPEGEYKEKDINIEFCEAVTKMREDFDDIKFKKIEKVTAVSVMHKGEYAGLGGAYAYVFKWIEENGYTVIDSPRENYIDGIWNKDKEEDWLTELQIPVKMGRE